MVTAFFNISGGEIFIILLVVFVIFGPDKIPEIARWLGKGVNEIKKATSEIRDEIDRETKDIRKTTDKLKDDFNRETSVLKKTDNAEDNRPEKAPENENAGKYKGREPRL
ncbi:MAG: twin-arginine translocase TatA/TatE family subunit [Bacteroidales bacterium]